MFPSHLQTYILTSPYNVLTRNFPNLWPKLFWQQYEFHCPILELCLRWKQHFHFLEMWHQSQHCLVLCGRDWQRMLLPSLQGCLHLGSSTAQHLALGGSADWRTKSPEQSPHSQCEWHLCNTEILQRGTEAILNINDLRISSRKDPLTVSPVQLPDEECSFPIQDFFTKCWCLFTQMLSCGLSFVFITIISGDNISDLLLCKKNNQTSLFCDNLI